LWHRLIAGPPEQHDWRCNQGRRWSPGGGEEPLVHSRYGNDIISCKSVSCEHYPVLCHVKRDMNDVAACIALCLTSDCSDPRDWSLILVGLLESKFKVTAFARSRYGCIEIDTDTPRQVEEYTQLLKRKRIYSSSLTLSAPKQLLTSLAPSKFMYR
jgi:hypothetical protein